MSDPLLDLSRRATDAIVALDLIESIPDGSMLAHSTRIAPLHGRIGSQEVNRASCMVGSTVDALMVHGLLLLDLRDDLTRAGALPLLVAAAFGVWRVWVSSDGNDRYDVWWQRVQGDDAEFCHLYAAGLSVEESCAYADCDHCIGCDGSPYEPLVMALEWLAEHREQRSQTAGRPASPAPTDRPGGQREP